MQIDIKIGIVTVSDRASSGIYDDESGPEIHSVLNEYIQSNWRAITVIIPDEQHLIEQTLIDLADNLGCSLIFTTGGTGPAKRDVTPDATKNVITKNMPGFSELMRSESLKYVKTAILSRQEAGIRGSCLIINLPGKPQAIRQCLSVVFPAIPYCIDLIDGPYITCYTDKVDVFRPKNQ